MLTRRNAHWLLAAALTGAVSFTALADGLTGKSGATFRMTLSKENPNLISVKGDPITAITDPNGSLTDQKKTGNGAVTVLAGDNKPFTLVLETLSGNSYLVNVTPRAGMGASYIIHGTEPTASKATRRWEEKTPYESVLVDIHQAIASGKTPGGYTLINTEPTSVTWPGIPLGLTRVALYSGGNLAIERYTLTNPLHYGVALRESDFAGRGVRSVMFIPQSASLIAGGRMEAVIIRDAGSVQ